MLYDNMDVSNREEQAWRLASEETAQTEKQELRERTLQLEFSIRQQRKLNEEMEEWVEMMYNNDVAESVKVLRSEKNRLSEQKKTLRQSVAKLCEVEDELAQAWDRLSEGKSVNRSNESHIRELKKKLESLKEEEEEIKAKLARLQTPSQKDKNKLSDLWATLQDLQHQMKQVQLDLKQKDELKEKNTLQLKQQAEELEEDGNITKDLRENIRHLTTQLESKQQEDLFAGMVYFMAGGGSSGRPMSLSDDVSIQAEELRDEAPAKSWWRYWAEGLAKGAKAAGTLTLVCLLPLGMVASTVPQNFSIDCDVRCPI